MFSTKKHLQLTLCTLFIILFSNQIHSQQLTLSPEGYFTSRGLDVTVFDDIYPDGHQTGVTVIQHGERTIANGDLRLEISPGQWSPVPKGGKKTVDTLQNIIIQELWYPDSSKNRVGFNPIIYPDLRFKYRMKVQPTKGHAFRITVDLDEEIPKEWVGKIGFNLEIFPGQVFGKTYSGGGKTGIFTPSPYGPVGLQKDGEMLGMALCQGKEIIISPEDERYAAKFISHMGELVLWDGRTNHNNGWFIVRAEVAAGKTKNVIDIEVDPTVIEGWEYEPVVQISQVGYYPGQNKMAVIETDKTHKNNLPLVLYKHDTGGKSIVKTMIPALWGNFLRYQYFTADFSDIKEEGIYSLSYGDTKTNAFRIDKNLLDRDVWQPIIDYFMPVQMCHMRVNEKYRVWHDFCHLDDALMAPIDTNHFDGYKQGPSTLTKFKPLQPVKGLNQGGWHDAGDYDLRVESQIGDVMNLALMLEEFDIDDYDATAIDAKKKIVEIHQQDGIPDLVQQIEHGLSSILGGYRAMGRLYRGIICNQLRQYVLLGDASSMTDQVWDKNPGLGDDDRWVFTEENPDRELNVAAGLAATSRVLKKYNPTLAKECLDVAIVLYQKAASKIRRPSGKLRTLVEFALTTEDQKWVNEIITMKSDVLSSFDRVGFHVGRIKHMIKDQELLKELDQKAELLGNKLRANAKADSPYGVPYKPNIWGAGWTLQEFGVDQYYFCKSWPDRGFTDLYANALNFILGVHPGNNTASFASGIGSNSLLVAYGVNRADWSYIPGGVGSGTALIRPNLPELKTWPYFWQQTEYVMGGGSTDFMFLVLAVRKLMSN